MNSSEKETSPDPLVLAYLCARSCLIGALLLFAAGVLVWKLCALLLSKKHLGLFSKIFYQSFHSALELLI